MSTYMVEYQLYSRYTIPSTTLKESLIPDERLKGGISSLAPKWVHVPHYPK